ncbi:hypothetical protein XENORESO_007511 [Xenotaenia resolanae]|uniref:Uncharacterized protein n=1 Tax=Xenotaenia resolanae TaxID=208358 RepID=A0ABV0WXV8_9TELE
MLKRLDRIRFRGQRRDEFLDPAESPNTSDTECSEDVVMKPRISVREAEELREPEGEQHIDTQAGPGSFSAGLQEEPKTDLNEVKGLLEIALLEKHFLLALVRMSETSFSKVIRNSAVSVTELHKPPQTYENR